MGSGKGFGANRCGTEGMRGRKMADKYQYFDGRKFTRDDATGYYLCSTKDKHGIRKRMHVYMWEYFNGPVPDGCHVHHMDEDKGNNSIENFRENRKKERRI